MMGDSQNIVGLGTSLSIQKCGGVPFRQAEFMSVKIQKMIIFLTIEDLRDMVGREGENFSNHVLHYTASLRVHVNIGCDKKAY